MLIQRFVVGIAILLFTSTISAADVNGRFVVMSTQNGKLEVLLQLNTGSAAADMGGATIVIGFNNYTLDFSQSPQSGTDYIYHNFSGGNYNTATVTKTSFCNLWLNIDLPYNNSNNGTTVNSGNEWTDLVTLFFNVTNPTDTLKLSWLTSSLYWDIYDADNQTLWNPASFSNINYVINHDTIQPELLSASLLDSVSLEIQFSEPLESSSALNINSYYINNGINILSAFLSTNQDRVILSTSPHIGMQQYELIVQNLSDLAGNLISPDHNTVQYIFESDTTPPEVTEVVPTNTRSITVKFSEMVEPASAKNKTNYSISDNITVNTVQLLPDTTGVVLKTSTHSSDIEYTISVTNIKDRSGNNMSQNSNSYRLPKRINGGKNKNSIENARSSNWSQNYIPENTIDGEGMSNPSSRWQSSGFMPVSIEYDLGSLQPVDSLRLSFYKWEAGRLYQYSLFASEDSVNWTPLLEEIWSEDVEWTELMVDSLQTRYIKLQLLQSNQSPYASLWEFELFGSDMPSNIENPEDKILLSDFNLNQNYPNPFNPSTKISYTIPNVISTEGRNPNVSLKVYDILGNEITTLVNDQKAPGQYEVTFDAAGLASGIYLYRLIAGDFIETKKMVLLR